MPRDFSNRFFGGCFLFLWSLATIALDGLIGWGIYRQLRATTYPTVQGTMILSRVETVGDGQRVQLRYIYTVGGQAFTGERYRYPAWSVDSRNAGTIVSSYPTDQPVEVAYNRANPADAVLETGLAGTDLFLLLLLTPLNVLMLVGWWWASRQRRRAGEDTIFAGLVVTRRHGQTQITLAVPRLLAAGIALGVLSVLFSLLIALVFGPHPPTRIMIGAWGLTVVVAVVVGVVDPVLGPGYRELVLDEQSRALRLVRRSRRSPARLIAAPAVQAIEIPVEPIPDRNGIPRRIYVPTLVTAGPNDTTHRVELCRWRSPARAEAFADGLLQWLAGHGFPAERRNWQTPDDDPKRQRQ